MIDENKKTEVKNADIYKKYLSGKYLFGIDEEDKGKHGNKDIIQKLYCG